MEEHKSNPHSQIENCPCYPNCDDMMHKQGGEQPQKPFWPPLPSQPIPAVWPSMGDTPDRSDLGRTDPVRPVPGRLQPWQPYDDEQEEDNWGRQQPWRREEDWNERPEWERQQPWSPRNLEMESAGRQGEADNSEDMDSDMGWDMDSDRQNSDMPDNRMRSDMKMPQSWGNPWMDESNMYDNPEADMNGDINMPQSRPSQEMNMPNGGAWPQTGTPSNQPWPGTATPNNQMWSGRQMLPNMRFSGNGRNSEMPGIQVRPDMENGRNQMDYDSTMPNNQMWNGSNMESDMESDMEMPENQMRPDMGMPGSRMNPNMEMPENQMNPEMWMPGNQMRPDMGMPENQMGPDMWMPGNQMNPNMGMPQNQMNPNMGMPGNQMNPEMWMPENQMGSEMEMPESQIMPNMRMPGNQNMPGYMYYPNGPADRMRGVINPVFRNDDMEKEEQETEHDLERLKGMYPDIAKKIQLFVEEACDDLEYAGSPMFDEQPDKISLMKTVNSIYDKVKEDAPVEEEEDKDDLFAMNKESRRRYPPGKNWLRDFVEVMLYNEMFQRRCRHRNCRRWY